MATFTTPERRAGTNPNTSMGWTRALFGTPPPPTSTQPMPTPGSFDHQPNQNGIDPFFQDLEARFDAASTNRSSPCYTHYNRSASPEQGRPDAIVLDEPRSVYKRSNLPNPFLQNSPRAGFGTGRSPHYSMPGSAPPEDGRRSSAFGIARRPAQPPRSVPGADVFATVMVKTTAANRKRGTEEEDSWDKRRPNKYRPHNADRFIATLRENSRTKNWFQVPSLDDLEPATQPAAASSDPARPRFKKGVRLDPPKQLGFGRLPVPPPDNGFVKTSFVDDSVAGATCKRQELHPNPKQHTARPVVGPETKSVRFHGEPSPPPPSSSSSFDDPFVDSSAGASCKRRKIHSNPQHTERVLSKWSVESLSPLKRGRLESLLEAAGSGGR